MSAGEMVWVDVARCTGCGTCVNVCPVEAVTVVEGKAHVDEETCTGCMACVAACPQGAMQPVLRGELVPVPQRPAPMVRRPSPLAETAGAVAVVAGTGLVARAIPALARAVGRWLTRRTSQGTPSARMEPRGVNSAARGARGGGGGGRRARRRRRGG